MSQALCYIGAVTGARMRNAFLPQGTGVRSGAQIGGAK